MSILTICALLGLFLFRFFNLQTKTFAVFICITLGVEYIGFYSLYLSEVKRSYQSLYDLYNLLELIFMSAFFYFTLKRTTNKKILIVLGSLVFLFELVWYFSPSQFHKMFSLNNIILSIFSILFFRELLNEENNVTKNSDFWIITGILFFNAGFFFLMSFINFIVTKDLELAQKLYSINHLLNIIYYSLVTYGFICQRRLAKSSL